MVVVTVRMFPLVVVTSVDVLAGPVQVSTLEVEVVDVPSH